MKKYDKIIEMMEEELEGYYKYMECAEDEEDPQLKQYYTQMANDELKHFGYFKLMYPEVVKEIEKIIAKYSKMMKL